MGGQQSTFVARRDDDDDDDDSSCDNRDNRCQNQNCAFFLRGRSSTAKTITNRRTGGGTNGKGSSTTTSGGGGGATMSSGGGSTTTKRTTTTKMIENRMGSPQPETPLYQRRKRAEAIHQAKTPVILEDQVIANAAAAAAPPAPAYNNNNNNSNNTNGRRQIIHDGPNCDKELHQKYELREVLGIGSTSTVHRCINKRTDEYYACKIIDEQQMEDRFSGMMAQFQTEIEALRDLQHPNIITLEDVYMVDQQQQPYHSSTNNHNNHYYNQSNNINNNSSGGGGSSKIYIIMELMEGGELFDYVVQKGTLNEEEASHIVHSVTSAMVYMHDRNIVHRDLKPENLLLKRKPKPAEPIVVKIIDFGLSKAMEEDVAHTFLGTRGYLAPEMLQRREYTKAVDTWALGVIIFVLLCGCLPFDDDSQTVPDDALVKSKFVLRFPRWASNLSPSAKDLLAKLLDTNYRTRYTAEQALQHPWVKGQTATKKNLLASPAQLRKSPHLCSPKKTALAARRAAQKADRHPNTDYSSPETPPGPIKRKQSL